MSRIHNILILPQCGWIDGKLNHGKTVDNFRESDFIWRAIDYMADIMEDYQVKYETLPIFHPPGLTNAQIKDYISDTTFVIELCLWLSPSGASTKANQTTITYHGSNHAKYLAEELATDISEWGSCSAFGHMTAHPKQLAAGFHGISIMPFYLDGPMVKDYWERSKEFGEDVGRAVAEYFEKQQIAVRQSPFMFNRG